MGILGGWYRRLGKTNAPRRQLVQPRRLNIEYLESRQLLAVLGLGFQLFRDTDNNNEPDTPVDQINEPLMVNETFWVDVLVEDQTPRQSDMGVVSLPLNLSWDPSVLELNTVVPAVLPDEVPIPAPADPSNAFSRMMTPKFELQRVVQDFDPTNGPFFPGGGPQDFNLFDLRGAALPNSDFGSAIGVNSPEDFGRLQFTILAATNATPFSIQLAGSLSFADASMVDNVAAITESSIPVPPQGNPIQSGFTVSAQDQANVRFRAPELENPDGENLTVTEFIRTASAETILLTGFVYADHRGVNSSDPSNGQLDRDPDTDAPLEFGLSNVEVQLFRTNPGADDSAGTLVQTMTTGPDGSYHFFIEEAGTYRLVEVQPANFIDGAESLGFVLPDIPRGTLGDNDEFIEITLDNGEHGGDYNFGEIMVPTKRAFLSSTDPRAMHCEALGVNCVTVEGTDADDSIVFRNTGDVLSVSVNGGPSQEFLLSQFDFVAIDAGVGQDTVTLEGTGAGEMANLQPLTGALRRGTDFDSSNYGALAVNAESILVSFEPGSDDAVVFRDSPAADQLSVDGSNVSLSRSGPTLSASAQNLVDATDRVFALSLTRPGVIEDDTVTTAALAAFSLELIPAANWQII